MSEKKPNNTYSDETKQKAVEAARNRGNKSLETVALEHNVTYAALQYWLAKDKRGEAPEPKKKPAPPAKKPKGKQSNFRKALRNMDAVAPARREPAAAIVMGQRDSDPVPAALADILKMDRMQQLRLLAALRAVFGVDLSVQQPR